MCTQTLWQLFMYSLHSYGKSWNITIFNRYIYIYVHMFIHASISMSRLVELNPGRASSSSGHGRVASQLGWDMMGWCPEVGS